MHQKKKSSTIQHGDVAYAVLLLARSIIQSFVCNMLRASKASIPMLGRPNEECYWCWNRARVLIAWPAGPAGSNKLGRA